ncbi:MAG TPA: hypothetical protein VFB81_05740, partial [Myxococcales bacterium]|nr:hypothetical protein [Myxococcales bacterium]
MQATPPEPPRGLRLRAETAAALLACAAAAIWIDLGHVHRMEDSDTLMPVMISLQKWTPFYWEQDRFGTLLPLIAMPVRDPLANLLVQRGAFFFLGLCSFLALARWVCGPERWQLLGLLGAAQFLALAPVVLDLDYLGAQPYSLSMALGIPALLVLEAPWRRAWRWP